VPGAGRLAPSSPCAEELDSAPEIQSSRPRMRKISLGFSASKLVTYSLRCGTGGSAAQIQMVVDPT